MSTQRVIPPQAEQRADSGIGSSGSATATMTNTGTRTLNDLITSNSILAA